MRPDDKTRRPAGDRATGSGDSLGGGISFTLSDFAALVASAEDAYVGALTHLSDTDCRHLLLPDGLVPAWSSVLTGAVYDAIVQCVDAGITPNFVGVADMLRRNAAELPAFVRGNLMAALSELTNEAPTAVRVGHDRRLVIEFAAFGRVAAQARRVAQMPREGSTLDDLAELIEREFGGVPIYLATAIAEVA